ncbi:MAG: hypothetical protein H7233_01970, partial [Pseudorhodobacter sp.]|nr:hypothetical protein [Frankiaceae bacterium]
MRRSARTTTLVLTVTASLCLGGTAAFAAVERPGLPSPVSARASALVTGATTTPDPAAPYADLTQASDAAFAPTLLAGAVACPASQPARPAPGRGDPGVARARAALPPVSGALTTGARTAVPATPSVELPPHRTGGLSRAPAPGATAHPRSRPVSRPGTPARRGTRPAAPPTLALALRAAGASQAPDVLALRALTARVATVHVRSVALASRARVLQARLTTAQRSLVATSARANAALSCSGQQQADATTAAARAATQDRALDASSVALRAQQDGLDSYAASLYRSGGLSQTGADPVGAVITYAKAHAAQQHAAAAATEAAAAAAQRLRDAATLQRTATVALARYTGAASGLPTQAAGALLASRQVLAGEVAASAQTAALAAAARAYEATLASATPGTAQTATARTVGARTAAALAAAHVAAVRVL